MLTDIGPTAGSQFYGSQIPAMGMNIANISSHIQKPGPAAMTMVVSVFFSWMRNIRVVIKITTATVAHLQVS